MRSYRVILNTDIGDNIDDAFALAMLLRCPEISLNGVITVLENQKRRALLIDAMRRAAGRESFTIAEGCRSTLATVPPKGKTLDASNYGPADFAGTEISTTDGVKYLSTARPDVLVAIGPMTDLAVTLTMLGGRERAGLDQCRCIAMCGEFEEPGCVEHNLSCDPEAAHLAFASGMCIDLVPSSIGPKVPLRPEDVKRLEKAAAKGDKLVTLLLDWLRQFNQNIPGETRLHDPMTVVALLRPELFEWRRGYVKVELRDEQCYGVSDLKEDPTGPHRVAFGIDADAARDFMLSRICQD